jgi:hypothetical protein
MNYLLGRQLTRETLRLKSTIARLKLKGIDGSLHKRWSMWFNSIIRAEPYQPLIISTLETGVAWLSSARVVKCLVKSFNERNPHFLLLIYFLMNVHKRKCF